jgi:hypothetical protein
MTPTQPVPRVPLTPATADNGSKEMDWLNLDPAVIPDLDVLVTEDHKPVESIFIEKQYRLLSHPLYSSWAGPGEERPFLMLTNVGWFYGYKLPPLVPDGLLSLDAIPSGDLFTKEGHSYYQWLVGKPPDVIIEIVSDRRGDEEGFKMLTCARQGVPFYVIFDPENLLGGGVLRAYRLQGRKYELIDAGWFPEVGLGLKLWPGTFEGQQQTWLRWCDQQGQVISTGAERAQDERRRADRLANQLRALGIEPEA